MTKKYQTKARNASALAIPEQVSVAMDEIAADMREGLLALAVGAGLQVSSGARLAPGCWVLGPAARRPVGADHRDHARHFGADR